MIPENPTAPPAAARQPRPLGLLPSLFLVAALSQLVYLLYWPMFLFGRWVPYLAAVGVALVRMGVYSGIGWGLVRRDRVAWAGAVFELGRTAVLFVAAMMHREGALTSTLFPAWWAQGLLSALLPLLLALLIALNFDWRPGSGLAVQVSLASRLLVAASVMVMFSLRHRHTEFGVRTEEHTRAMLLHGLPIALFLTGVEAAAAFLVLRGS